MRTTVRFLAMCIVLFVAESSRAVLVEHMLELQDMFVNTASLDTNVRYGSYREALNAVSDSVEAESLFVQTEINHETLGRFVVFRQQYRDLPVMHSLGWLKISKESEALVGLVRYHASIGLANEAYLSYASDQDSLQYVALGYCADLDSVWHVEPVVWSECDSVSGQWSYVYALEVNSYAPGQSRIVNWETGELIRYLPVFHVGDTEVHGTVHQWYRYNGDNEWHSWGVADGAVVSSAYQDDNNVFQTDEVYVDGGGFTHLTANDGPDDGTPSSWTINAHAKDFYMTWSIWQDTERPWTCGETVYYPPNAGISYDYWFPNNNDLDRNRSTLLAFVPNPIFNINNRMGTPPASPFVNCMVRPTTDGSISAETEWNSDQNRPLVRYGFENHTRWAEYHDVFMHELGHAIQLRYYGPFGIPNDWGYGSAAAEACADFLAAAYGGPNGNPLILPASDGSATTRDIASSELTMDDYDGNFPYNVESNAGILSRALWEAYQLIYDDGGESQARLFLDAVLIAHTLRPVTFAEWAYAIATVLDGDDNDLCDGWSFGYQMYDAFWRSREIECRPLGESEIGKVDGWLFYRGSTSGHSMESDNPLANGSAATSNIIRGTTADYMVFEHENRIMLGQRRNGSHIWWFRLLDMCYWPYQRSNFQPSLALSQGSNDDIIYVSAYDNWRDDEGDFWNFDRYKITIAHSDGQCDFSIMYGFPIDCNSESHSVPTFVAAHGLPTLFGAAQSADPPTYTGINYFVVDNIFSWRFPVHRMIPGTVGQVITEVATNSVVEGTKVYLAWISGNQIYYCNGTVDGNNYSWSGIQTITQLNDGISDKKNICIQYSAGLDGVFIAWEGTDASNGNQVVGFSWSNTDEMTFSQAEYFENAPCVFACNPTLNAISSSVSDPTGMARIALAFDRHEQVGSYSSVPSVVVCGLRVDEQNPGDRSQWRWMSPALIGFGRNPSLATTDAEGEYLLSYVDYSASGPFDILTEEIALTYPPAISNPSVATLSIEEDLTLITPVTLAKSITVGGNATLSIPLVCDQEALPHISGMPGTKIIVEEGGTLAIQGTQSSPIKFQSYDPTQTWGGIKVEGGTLNMDYAEIKDCDTVCVWTYKPEQVSITNCVLHGDKMVSGSSVLRLYSNPEKSQYVANTQILNAPYATGLNAKGCDVKFDNVEVKNCYANSYISSVTGNFRDCAFGGRTSKHGVMFLSTGNTPNFQCCQFEDLSPLGGSYQSTIYAMDGSAPSFGYVGLTQGASNTVSDSSVALLKMFGSGVLPIIANGMSSGPGGKNDWYQKKSSGYNLYWGSPYPKPLKQYYAKQQYWDPAPATLSDFYPSDATYFEYSASPAKAWELCGDATSSVSDRGAPHESGLDDADPVYDSLFALAMSHEILREFALSQPLFRTIVREEDDYYLSWLAMTHAASNQRFLQDSVDGSWIVPMIDSLVGVAPDSMEYDAAVAGGRLKANFYVSIYEYEAAIDELADLLESDLTERDSLLVSLELLDAYVAAGLIEDDGSLDGTTAARVPSRLRVKSDAEAWVVEQEIVERLGQIMGSDEPERTEPLPTEFRLYQNYPNPFNPTTQIEFDLPDGAPVTLKVFNTLGQEVATLLDATRPAGHHVVLWNGKNSMGGDVATGLYVYQIQAGGFTDTKKMVLLR